MLKNHFRNSVASIGPQLIFTHESMNYLQGFHQGNKDIYQIDKKSMCCPATNQLIEY